MTLLQHATAVLEKTDTPMRSQEIVKGYTPPKGGRTPHETLRVTVSTKPTPIEKIGPNQYLLKAKAAEYRTKQIEKIAYSLWEKAGKPFCDGIEFWCQAERTFDQVRK